MVCSDHCLYLMCVTSGRHENITKCFHGNLLITHQVYTFNSEIVLNSNDLTQDNPQFITCYCCHRNIAKWQPFNNMPTVHYLTLSTSVLVLIVIVLFDLTTVVLV